jgi:superfamily I DNA/RNA helicase
VSLSQPGVLPQHILCITFTNKAAEELQTRLRQAMKEARAIAAAAAAGAQQQRQQQVADEDMGYSGVLACTFHSYCYRLLRRHFRVRPPWSSSRSSSLQLMSAMELLV